MRTPESNESLKNEIVKLLIVEDEEEIFTRINKYFTKMGLEKGLVFDVRVSQNLLSAKEQIVKFRPHVAIIDLKIPEKEDGKAVRLAGIDLVSKDTWLGKIIYTSESIDRIGSGLLDIGADYYLQKPAGLDILLSATISVLRRIGISSDSTARSDLKGKSLAFGRGRLELNTHSVILADGKRIDLTPTEYVLVKYLIEKSRITESEFFQNVVEMSRSSNERLFHNTIYRLRKKIYQDFISLEKDGSYTIK